MFYGEEWSIIQYKGLLVENENNSFCKYVF